MLDDLELHSFQETVLDYYLKHGRHALPWRLPEGSGRFSAYKIVVSEVMLQQTQVPRVIPKYQAFLTTFPDVKTLAAAEPGAVLRAWSGLGYNRRAKFLHNAARQVVQDYAGHFPESVAELTQLSGIGPNTAGAIAAYAFNQPVTFIETNIRTVFLHHFFTGQTEVSDKKILPLITQSLDKTQPREWYWALMDYGTFLKTSVGNLNVYSRGYTRQSVFHGSRRQIRGRIIRLLAERAYDLRELEDTVNDERFAAVMTELAHEQLIRVTDNRASL